MAQRCLICGEKLKYNKSLQLEVCPACWGEDDLSENREEGDEEQNDNLQDAV